MVAADTGEPPPLPDQDGSAPIRDSRHLGIYARAGP